MRKFLSPIINLVSLILVGIAFGLAGLTAAKEMDIAAMGSYYQLVWVNKTVIGLVGFFLICVGALGVLATFIPKARKCVAPLTGILLIGGGVLSLLTAESVLNAAGKATTAVNQSGLIGMAVLLFIAGAFSLIITVIEFVLKD